MLKICDIFKVKEMGARVIIVTLAAIFVYILMKFIYKDSNVGIAFYSAHFLMNLIVVLFLINICIYTGINIRNINERQKIKNIILYIFMIILSLFVIFLFAIFGILWLLSVEIWFIFLYITCFILLLSAFWIFGALLIKKAIFIGYVTPKMKIVWCIDIILCAIVLGYAFKLLLAG